MGVELALDGKRLGPDRTRYIAALLANLPMMDGTELADLWRSVEDAEPPKLTDGQLRQLIAYRLQVRHYGGLSRASERELRRIAQAATGPTSASTHGLGAGARLIREWRGRTINVQVRERDYLWEGRSYRSLSAIAQEVTGAKWSGPRFFGITGNG